MRKGHLHWFSLHLRRDVANRNDRRCLHDPSSCDLSLATCSGPFEVSGPAYRPSALLKSGAPGTRWTTGGHEGGQAWPCWKTWMREYPCSLH